MGVVNYQQPSVAKGLAREPQHLGGLTRVGDVDHVAECGERDRGHRRRPSDPVHVAELRAEPRRGRASQRGLAYPGGADQHRARPLAHTGFDQL